MHWDAPENLLWSSLRSAMHGMNHKDHKEALSQQSTWFCRLEPTESFSSGTTATVSVVLEQGAPATSSVHLCILQAVFGCQRFDYEGVSGIERKWLAPQPRKQDPKCFALRVCSWRVSLRPTAEPTITAVAPVSLYGLFGFV